jgi:hypothetical protein
MQTKSIRTLGSAIFFLGIFFGLALAIATTWASFESVFYFYTGATYDSFGGLRCPNLMTLSDTGIVAARFDNPTGQDIDPYYRVEMSGVIPREFENQLTVPPHQTNNIQWTVNSNDVDYSNFIFVKLEILPDAYYSSSQATCGIMMINIRGLSGGQILALLLTVSLLGIVLGLELWASVNDKTSNNYSNDLRVRQALGIFVSLAVLAGLTGWWVAGTIFCVLTILLLVILIR